MQGSEWLVPKLHCSTPGLVRTSAGSTPYKGTTSPIPIEPLLLLLLLLLDTYRVFFRGSVICRVGMLYEHCHCLCVSYRCKNMHHVTVTEKLIVFLTHSPQNDKSRCLNQTTEERHKKWRPLCDVRKVQSLTVTTNVSY